MQFSLDIVNEKGLHARASAKFVETVERFDARALVQPRRHGGLGQLDHGADDARAPRCGTSIEVSVEGAEAEPLAAALRALVAGRFGEAN